MPLTANVAPHTQNMASDDESTHLQRALLAPTRRPMAEAIGWVSVAIAGALAAFDAFLVAPLVRGSASPFVLLGLIAFSTGLTYFFAAVGYRLVRARPNAVGSIANPAVWFTCFVCFAILALLFLAGAIAKSDFAFAQCAAVAALLALLAFGAATHFRRHR